MKRILIFSLAYYPTRIGGAEVAIKEITDRIPGIEFDLVTLRVDKRLPQTERVGNVTLYRLGPSADIRVLENPPWQVNLAKILFPITAFLTAHNLQRKRPYDAVWSMMAAHAGFAALFFKLTHPRVPYLLTLQEGREVEGITHQMRFVTPVFRRIFTRADRVQVISNYLGAWARRMGYTGQVDVIPNAVDTARFKPDTSPQERERIRTSWGVAADDTALITTSRLAHKNALDDVIRALPLLPGPVKFLIYGTGPDKKMLESLAQECGVAERVIFGGQAAHVDVPRLLAASDIFIRPSRSEGMGNSFIEAFAAGLPVITTQVGGIADFLFDERRNPDKKTTGWVVDADTPEQIAEAVENILERPDKVTEVTQNARELALTKYDWNLTAANMRALFDDLLKTR